MPQGGPVVDSPNDWAALYTLVGAPVTRWRGEPGNVPQPDEETRKHCESETAQRVR